MVLKRKAVSTLSKHVAEDPEDVQEQAKVMKAPQTPMMKKPAASSREEEETAEPMEENNEEEDEKEGEQEEEEEEEPEEISEEQKQQELEEQEVAKRTKELKATAVNEIKDLVAKMGLETGNKKDMIDAIVAYEAKVRADARAHEAKLRLVVLQKKEELEQQSVSELAKLCNAIGVKGRMSNKDRVQLLLKHWQEDDGVDKALQIQAFEARKAELEAMDKASLQDLCEQANIDPFNAEVMVDRIAKMEHEMGRFSRPTLTDEEPAAAAKKEENVDMVTALLQKEKNRKKDKELKERREEEIANRIKQVQAMTIQDIKDELTKKGAEPTGKKDEMLKALLDIRAQEDKVNARKAEWKAMGVQAVKELCVKQGLKTGSMGEMLTALLAHEAKKQEEIRAYDAKFDEVLVQKKDELKDKSNAELKELCASRSLKPGVSKEERLERLLEDANRDGEIDTLVVRTMRNARKDALLVTEKKELVKMCEEIDADPLAKEVMVERILEHEKEFGPVVVAPPAKKLRTSKK